MKKTIFFVVLAVLCLFFKVDGQVRAPLEWEQALSVGDRVPDFEFNNVLNYGKPVLRLSDFKGKAILIDFWATWCGSCLAHIPEVMAMQRAYGKRLQVLAVNGSMREDRVMLERFLKKRVGSNGAFIVPVIYQDTLLRRAFPRRAIPHYVWIGPDGRVKAITGSEALKEDNFAKLVAGYSLNLKVKED